MPIVHIQLLEGRPPEKVEEVIRKVTETLSATLDSPKENVRVLVTEVSKSHWGIGGTPVSKLRP
ncbi:4-oxalocrotonate tautomerase [Bacillus sp. FSL W8-0445]|jgi:4-oxalocrotonate tautomerase|uniref:Tautomerase n=2 Tax=Bacillus licheniformis TaxID=1402 RepID=Q65DQ9_BACLD|nr:MULTISPECIES: 4-oxalocrotonate tautomerase [Bacillus]MBJ7885274.1 4-oxalocrotonate tautomerase [Bacillaceae bacterium HSR45]MDP4080006.1 4-oxalocrotonate tautomerase [Bacillota bacterium]AAU25430.1 4-oxalocrotonate tautomerase [Bacillus licheniformis DSM 13 = ATCC 14580]AAU42805.1 4-oxalocrotonate tautomerase [Bacillus licheniformis DSM 13 = ATCC 14580]AKQ75262.1 4-oxalocrotonate tautomerase [Bacillus licheniformis WX-02]